MINMNIYLKPFTELSDVQTVKELLEKQKNKGYYELSGITGSADANASKSLTLLTIAAVVMGGGKLEGGVVSHYGAVFGAVTLSLISVLLGFLNVNTDFTAAIQGIILLSVLAMGLLKRESSK